MPVAYPANYGSLTQSLAGDGDPLDVVFYTRAPMTPGTLIKLRPIGVLKMIDGGEKDDKIIAVPASKIDPTYDDIMTITDLPKSSSSGWRPSSGSIKNCQRGVKRLSWPVLTMPPLRSRRSNRHWEAWKAKNPQ